jgi:hypothetical protein
MDSFQNTGPLLVLLVDPDGRLVSRSDAVPVLTGST